MHLLVMMFGLLLVLAGIWFSYLDWSGRESVAPRFNSVRQPAGLITIAFGAFMVVLGAVF